MRRTSYEKYRIRKILAGALICALCLGTLPAGAAESNGSDGANVTNVTTETTDADTSDNIDTSDTADTGSSTDANSETGTSAGTSDGTSGGTSNGESATEDTASSGTGSSSSSEESSTSKKKVKTIKLKKATITSVNGYEGNVTIKWKKVKKAKKYEILRSTNKNSGYKKIATVKKLKYVDKTAKKRKTYYYKVRAVATQTNGKTVKGKTSASKKIYARPKTPTTVICGECFVEGMSMYARSYGGSNYHFVYKVGVSTSGLLHTRYISYGGRTLTAFERVMAYNPDRVYFLCGINEVYSAASNATGNYETMIKRLKQQNPNVEVILIALPPQSGSYAKLNSYSRKYNAAYKKLAAKYENVYYYDEYLDAMTTSSGLLSSSFNGGDGCHWNVSGYITNFKKIVAWSKKLTRLGSAIED